MPSLTCASRDANFILNLRRTGSYRVSDPCLQELDGLHVENIRKETRLEQEARQGLLRGFRGESPVA